MPSKTKKTSKKKKKDEGEGEGQMRAFKYKCPEARKLGALEKPQVLQ